MPSRARSLPQAQVILQDAKGLGTCGPSQRQKANLKEKWEEARATGNKIERMLETEKGNMYEIVSRSANLHKQQQLCAPRACRRNLSWIFPVWPSRSTRHASPGCFLTDASVSSCPLASGWVQPVGGSTGRQKGRSKASLKFNFSASLLVR